MIVCRSLLRIECALKFVNPHALLAKPRPYSQGECFYGLTYHRKMGDSPNSQNSVDHKKGQMTITVWRAVSKQSNSYEDSLDKDSKVEPENFHEGDAVEKLEVGSQVLKEPCRISDSVSDFVKIKTESSSDHNRVNATSSFNVSEDIDEDIGKRSIPSADKHSISVQVGASLLRFIRSTQQKIEEDTGVKIKFPSLGDHEDIVIEGSSIESVTRASEEIHIIVDEVVRKPKFDFTHFVSLPLAIHPELVGKLINFQKSILGEENEIDSDGDNSKDEENGEKLCAELGSKDVNVDRTSIPIISYPPRALKAPIFDLRIDRSIFIKPKTFHLTVLMLKLWNKNRVAAASAVLQSVSSKVMDVLGGKPVVVKLEGLACMKGTPAQARVVYAPTKEVGSESRLLKACQVIIDSFVEAGLVLEEDAKQKLQLHATVMNVRHRKRWSRSKMRRGDWFDAREIFEQFGAEEWGEYLLPEVHLSKRFTYDENGYYHCCASIPLPKNMPVD